MNNRVVSFSGSFGPEGFFKEIFGRIGPNAGIPEWQQAVALLRIVQELYEKFLKECAGDEFEATRKTLEEFYGKHQGQKLIDELGPAKAEKGTGVTPAPPNPNAQDSDKPTPSPESPAGEPSKPEKPENGSGNKKNKGKKKKRSSGSGEKPAKKGGRRKGVGNTKREEYPSAHHLTLKMPAHLFVGSFCPSCHTGRLQQTAARECLRFVAAALLSPLILDIERLRCSNCRQIFEAELPRKYSGEEVVCKATAEAMALSVLLRYGLGFPDHRLETLQAWQSVPFSDANQWTIANTLFESFEILENHLHRVAANADRREVDDCSVRVVELQRVIAREVANAEAHGLDAKSVRTGINVTSYVAHLENKEYRIFFIGREHQGEREHALAELRDDTRPPVVRVSDAASKGQTLKPFPEKNDQGFTPVARRVHKTTPKQESADVQAFCLAHLVLTIQAAEAGFRAEVATLLGLLTGVFSLDEKTKAMTPEERLAFHQKHSAPLMESLKNFIDREIQENLKAEPNSLYGKAIRYAFNHWRGFTEFLRTPGIPLTTNEVELANKFTKLHHKNSLSFQTAHGARVGAFYMSLIATAIGMNENPLEYLTTIIRYRAFIKTENAGDWMPHTYRAAAAEAKKTLETQGNPDGYRIRHRKVRVKDEAPEHEVKSLPSTGNQPNVTLHN